VVLDAIRHLFAKGRAAQSLGLLVLGGRRNPIPHFDRHLG